jgi:hypothetical protein
VPEDIRVSLGNGSILGTFVPIKLKRAETPESSEETATAIAKAHVDMKEKTIWKKWP